MSDEQISLLERYLLEDDKEKFFGTLVKNSETYVNMRLLDHINRFGLELPKDSQAELQKFLSEPKNKKTLVQFKQMLLEIAAEADQVKRKKLISTFNTEYMKINFSYSRPANVKQSDNLKSQNEFKLPSAFSGNDFNFEKQVEEFFNQPDWAKIKNFRTNHFYKFDLRRLLDKKIDCFEHVLNCLTTFTHITVVDFNQRTLISFLSTTLLKRRKLTKDSFLTALSSQR
jgi:hypothetical protein